MKAREKIWKTIKTKILGAKVRYRMLILYLVGGVIPMILIGNYLIQGTDRLLIKQAKNTEVTGERAGLPGPFHYPDGVFRI